MCRPHHHRPRRRVPAAGRRATLVLREPGGSGALVARPRRLPDQLLARMLGPSLDRELAAGRQPESARLLAARADDIVSLRRRQALARDWDHVLEMARRPPGPGSARVLLRRDRLAAAEPEVHEMMTRLLAPLPVAAQGVAAVIVLLTDATGPLYNLRNHTPLVTLLRAATVQLDPSAPLVGPTGI